jgi:tetratricopeptide (TPR) repeat protein
MLISSISKDTTLKIKQYEKIIQLDERMYKDNPKETKEDFAQHLNSLGWYYLLNRQFTKAETLFKKGIEINSSNVYLQSNIPHILLFLGKTKKAMQLYLELKDKEFDKEAGYATFKDAFMSDFTDFEKQGMDKSLFVQIKKALNEH